MSILRLVAVLDALDDHPDGLRESDIRLAVDLPKATTHRLVKAMTELSILRRIEPGNVYVLGPALIRWGTTAVSSINVRSTARPFLESLSATTEETTHLGVLDGSSILYLDIVDSPHAVRMSSRVGGTMPAYSTAMGKCLLAHLSIGDRDRALAQPLVRRTANTITSRQVLVQQLENAMLLGYALDDGENEEGVSCAAAPLFDHLGHVVGAISVSTPTFRLSSPIQHVPALLEVAHAISFVLGHPTAPDFAGNREETLTGTDPGVEREHASGRTPVRHSGQVSQVVR